ncbi:MAG: M48 family metallopeptidase [Myxococcaceae bacterium]
MKTSLIGLVLAYGVVAALPCGHIPDPTNIGDVQDAVHTTAETAKTAGDLSKCGDLQKQTVSYDEEMDLGGSVAVNFAASNRGLYLDYAKGSTSEMREPSNVKFNEGPGTKASKYVTLVGKNLALQSTRADIAWKFGILNNDKAVNAVSAPGGYVLITKALLEKVQNEDQLAGVLAHEIGHVVARHALKVYQAVKTNQCKAAALSDSELANQASEAGMGAIDPGGYRNEMKNLVDSGSDAFDLNANLNVLTMFTNKVVEEITTKGYDSEQEFEADQIAADLLGSAGYSVDEYMKFLGTLKSDSTAFAHHPPPADRIKAINKHLQEKANPFVAPKRDKPVPKAVQ